MIPFYVGTGKQGTTDDGMQTGETVDEKLLPFAEGVSTLIGEYALVCWDRDVASRGIALDEKLRFTRLAGVWRAFHADTHNFVARWEPRMLPRELDADLGGWSQHQEAPAGLVYENGVLRWQNVETGDDISLSFTTPLIEPLVV